jgi:hypothetical protein
MVLINQTKKTTMNGTATLILKKGKITLKPELFKVD